MEDLAVTIICLAFYGGIYVLIFRYVNKRRHFSQPPWRSFAIVAGSITAALFGPLIILTLVGDGLPRNTILSSFLIGAIIVLAIRAWRKAMKYVSEPRQEASQSDTA